MIEVQGLTFAYPGADAPTLRAVSFSVAAGERVAILGPNGAGKTTLMLQLNGILRPSSGSVTIGGVVLDRRNVRDIRRRVGVVFQDPDDQLFLPTIGEDVAFGPQNFALPDVAERVEAALAAVGMGALADRHPARLSLGQRRRAAIATILAMDPDVIVLDEPTSNLDPAGRRELSATLRTLPATQLIVTHDLLYAAEHCTRTIILDAGRIAADGPTREVLSDGALLAAHSLELPWGFDPARI